MAQCLFHVFGETNCLISFKVTTTKKILSITLDAQEKARGNTKIHQIKCTTNKDNHMGLNILDTWKQSGYKDIMNTTNIITRHETLYYFKSIAHNNNKKYIFFFIHIQL